jgi:hypothetical protein
MRDKVSNDEVISIPAARVPRAPGARLSERDKKDKASIYHLRHHLTARNRTNEPVGEMTVGQFSVSVTMT